MPALLRDLRVARRQGYAVMRDEWATGVASVGVATPVLLGPRPVAISIALPSFEATADTVETLGTMLVKTARTAFPESIARRVR